MFLCKALQHMQKEPCIELHVCFKRSYDEVLRHHHTFVVRSLAIVRYLSCYSAPTFRALGLWLIGRYRSPSGRFLTAEISSLASRKEGTRTSSVLSSPSG